MHNPFFKNFGPFKIKDLLNKLKIDNTLILNNDLISDIKDLVSAKENELTFFHSKKYEQQAKITKAGYCITLKNLAHYLPNTCKPIYVDNVLKATMTDTTLNLTFNDPGTFMVEFKKADHLDYKQKIIVARQS